MAEENIEKIKNKVETFSLSISRISRPTYLAFKELATNYFCDDYGACLSYLIDNLKYNDFLSMIINHEERISALENKKPEKPITFGDVNNKVNVKNEVSNQSRKEN